MAPALTAALEVPCRSLGLVPEAHPSQASKVPIRDRGTYMNLGNFSVSLAVTNLDASRRFYEALGFSVFGGEATQGWLIMKSDSAVIGLFQGMFERNILTFNPGWDANAQPLASFTDVRELQRRLQAKGIAIQQPADPTTSGPASFMVMDPDGNPILVDQHV